MYFFVALNSEDDDGSANHHLAERVPVRGPSSTTAWIRELSSTREQSSSDWGFSQRIMRLIRNKAEPVGGWGVGVEGPRGACRE